MKLSNNEIIKDIDFSDNTDRTHGRYDFSFSTVDAEGADMFDYDGYIIVQPSDSRMDDEIEWGQNVPEDWEKAEEILIDEFYKWKNQGKNNLGQIINFQEFTIDGFGNYVNSKGGDIDFSISEGNNIKYKEKTLSSLPKQNFKNSLFSIGDIGKEINVFKGNENIYADFVVYDEDNDIFTISLFSKENHDGLKSITDDIIKKYANGGGIGDTYSIKEIKVGDLIKDKYSYEAEVLYNDGEKIEAEYKSGAVYTYRQKDFDNGEVDFLWGNRNIMRNGGGVHGVSKYWVSYVNELENNPKRKSLFTNSLIDAENLAKGIKKGYSSISELKENGYNSFEYYIDGVATYQDDYFDTIPKKYAKGGMVEPYDEEKYSSEYDYLRKIITKNFGEKNRNFSSADWGGLDNWTIKGNMYEGIFIVIDDNAKVILMQRKHNEELEENEDTDILEAEVNDTKALQKLFTKALEIKENKMDNGRMKTHFNELENTELRNVLISFWNDFLNNHIGNYLSIEKENYILSNIDNVFVIVRDKDKGNFTDVEKQKIDSFLSPYFESYKKPLFTEFFNKYEIKDNKIILHIKGQKMYAKGGGIKKPKTAIGKITGKQYGYTLSDIEKMWGFVLVSPKEYWDLENGTTYTDSFGRTQTITDRDKERIMTGYAYRIMIFLDLGSKKVPLSAKKYAQKMFEFAPNKIDVKYPPEDTSFELGGTIDSVRRFKEADFNKLMDEKGFSATWSGYVWEIFPKDGGKVLGKFNPKTNTLFILGKKDLSNMLVEYLQKNSLVSSDEYYKLGNGGNVGRDLLFKSKQPHEQRYKRKREWKEYKKEGWFDSMFKDGGSVNSEFDYMMLSRLQSDVDYFLGYGNRNEKVLWAGNIDDHINEMKRLWNKLLIKPEWLSMDEILDYESKMKNKFEKGGEAKSFSGYLGEVISINMVETALGRKIDTWQDDVVILDGIKYKKVYLRPEYKQI